MRHLINLTEAIQDGDPVPPDTPIGDFIAHFEKMKSDDFRNIIGVGRDYEFESVDVVFNLRPVDEHRVILQSLASRSPGEGEGAQAMSILCKVADRCHVTIELDASPYTTNASREKMSRETLMQWYQRFGFVPTSNSEMRRTPQ